MQMLFSRNNCCAAVAAVAILGFTGLVLNHTLDRAYESALPKGTVEIREIQPAAAGNFAASRLRCAALSV